MALPEPNKVKLFQGVCVSPGTVAESITDMVQDIEKTQGHRKKLTVLQFLRRHALFNFLQVWNDQVL